MWNYEKRLQYPVNIKTPNAKLAQFIMSQYGGRYISTLSVHKQAWQVAKPSRLFLIKLQIFFNFFHNLNTWKY